MRQKRRTKGGMPHSNRDKPANTQRERKDTNREMSKQDGFPSAGPDIDTETNGVEMSGMHRMPMAGSVGAPFFLGRNVREFLACFEDLCANYGVAGSQKVPLVLRYCSTSIGHYLRTLPAFVASDWEELRASMLSKWEVEMDEQKMWTMAFLEALKSKPRSDDDDIRQYARQFKVTSTYLVSSGQLSKYLQGLWFIQGLPDNAKEELIHSERISLEDPKTMDFGRFYDAVLKICKTKESLSGLRDFQHHVEKARILVDRFQRKPTILDMSPGI